MEESSAGGRCGEIASDISVALVTVAQLIFFTSFHKYIAWYTTAADGTVTRQSLLTDDYFAWLPFPTVASIVVVVATLIMLVYNRYWFRQIAWILFCIMGITVVGSLLTIFPFDFSVIPSATAVDVVPTVVRVVLILMALFYGGTALVMIVQLRNYAVRGERGNS